jgi:hypothetical protein
VVNVFAGLPQWFALPRVGASSEASPNASRSAAGVEIGHQSLIGKTNAGAMV